MQKLKNIIVVDGDEISSFISQGVFRDLKLPYNITYLSGIWQGLDYLKQTCPKGGSEAGKSQDMLLLGITLEHFEFLDELEGRQEIDTERLHIILLTHMFTDRQLQKIKAYKNIEACFPKMLSEAVVGEVLDNYLASVPSYCNNAEKKASASALNRSSLPFPNTNQREKERKV